ncbi:MAG: hypothetical protein KBD07_03320 [Candidatus Omnitrophica bacterium]|jgi:hypothetical protein|nr:hypothetical protein [Candidatus Omnitrophota bacterium]
MRHFNPKSWLVTKPLTSRKGMVFPVVMAVTLIASIEMASLGLYAATQVKQIRTSETYMKSFYVAEAAVQKAAAQIRYHINTFASLPDAQELALMEAEVPGTSGEFTVLDYSIAMGSLDLGTSISSGNYQGLRADTQTIDITAQIKGPSAGAQPVTVHQSIEIQQIPVFQFGVFYDNDLEILPGATMTFEGRVHTNADIYLETSASLTFDSGITAVGDIFHGRKDSSAAATGNIYVKDSSGDDQNMKNDDSSWLDSNHDDWLVESQARWSENVKSDVHNTRELNLPLPVTEEVSSIIERRALDDSDSDLQQKLDYKAQIRIIDGTIKDQNGSTINFNYCSTGGSLSKCSAANTVTPITFPSQTFSGTCNNASHFKDVRENKCVKATEIDIAKLNLSPKYIQLKNANPSGLVFYHSDLRNAASSTYRDALRVKNGSQFLTKTTFASQNPVYVAGNFNNVNKTNVGIIGDSMNILSTNWSDSNSTSSLSSRTAANTTVNAAVIAGNTETTTGHYNGGFENIHRFLENWSGKTVTFSGSVAVLYNSQIATGAWGQSNVYNAPNRNWGYDTALSGVSANVPGFPSVINLTKGAWQQDE